MTLTPRPAHSHASDWVIFTTAAFEQLYAAWCYGHRVRARARARARVRRARFGLLTIKVPNH